MPDMSGTFGSQRDAWIKRAKAFEAAGNLQEARKAYLRASQLALKYAEYGSSTAIKQQRLKRAKNLHAKADSLKAGAAPVRSGAGAGAAAKSHEEADDADREAVRRCITKSNVQWDDIAGLDGVKEALNTAYVMALAQPPDGVKLSPSRTVLLYGPPGTGKTLLAQAVSTSFDATFFNIKTGALLSSLFGKSPQLIAAAFAEAEARAPSVLFFDEIEALVGSRDQEMSQAEGRVVTAFLQSLGGFDARTATGFVFTIAATNTPWKVDDAILSRFARKVCVPLPDHACRRRILELTLHERGYKTTIDLDAMADLTDGFSGRELAKQICDKAIAAAIRESNPDVAAHARRSREEVAKVQLRLEPITERQFRDAMASTKPVTDARELRRYEDWGSQQA